MNGMDIEEDQELQDVNNDLLLATLSELNKLRTDDKLINNFKPKQAEAIIAGGNGNDVLAILPTGYGKSLIFEAIPIFRKLCEGIDVKTIVISPLNVIIDQQVSALGSAAYRLSRTDQLGDRDSDDEGSIASSSTDDDSDESDSEQKLHQEEADKQMREKEDHITAIKQGSFSFLVGHPEDFLEDGIRRAIGQSSWAKDVKLLVVDECHTAVQWSDDFRKDYGNIDQLKAVYPNASILALTATASLKMQAEIKRILNIGSATVISAEVDRVNIKYCVRERPSSYCETETSYSSVFMPYFKELKAQSSAFPKTVIYATLKWCGYGNELGVRELTTNVTSDGVPDIAQYHAPLSSEVKQTVAEDMKSQDSPLRLLFATEAYGMGVDTPDIRRVLHAGPPCTLETYMQTTGRGGRDGGPCEAVLYFNNQDLGKQTVQKEVKTFCRMEECRRKYLCEFFGTQQSFSGAKHDCCDFCDKSCTCEMCSAKVTEPCPVEKEEHISDVEVAIYYYLKQVFFDENEHQSDSEKALFDPQLLTGLDDELARDIASNYEHLASLENLQLMYFHLMPEYLVIIDECITRCTCDFR